MQALENQPTPLGEAVAFLQRESATAPSAESVVNTLVAAEKAARRSRTRCSYADLLGHWRLGFITGTKRSRQRAGVVLGAGRFLPRWVKITITYAASEPESDRGSVENTVEFGLVRLTVSGPTLFHASNNLLAFDFTRMTLAVAGRSLYSGYIRNGQQRDAAFYQQPLKKQAFFTYFLVTEEYIAARGRGGGLALWVKQ